METTEYFKESVPRKHPEASRENWIQEVLREPAEREFQPNGRIRHWGYVAEARRWLRVVTLADGVTVHNAFFDRGYGRQYEVRDV